MRTLLQSAWLGLSVAGLLLVGPSSNAAPAATGDRPVLVEMRVPANAQVWFNGAPTSQTGTVRQYVSPALTPDREFTYKLHVRWRNGDRAVDQTREVVVRAGDRVSLEFGTPPTSERLSYYSGAPIAPPAAQVYSYPANTGPVYNDSAIRNPGQPPALDTTPADPRDYDLWQYMIAH